MCLTTYVQLPPVVLIDFIHSLYQVYAKEMFAIKISWKQQMMPYMLWAIWK